MMGAGCVPEVCVCVVGESNSQMVGLSDELSKKNEEVLRHQEEISGLLSQMVDLQHRVKEVRSSRRRREGGA